MEIFTALTFQCILTMSSMFPGNDHAFQTKPHQTESTMYQFLTLRTVSKRTYDALKICYQDFCNTSLRPSSCPCPLLTKQQLLKYNVNIVKLQVQKHRTCNVKHYFTSELYYKTNVLKKKKRYFFNQAEECELSTNLTSI